MECSGGSVLERLDKVMASPELSRWVQEFMSGFTAAWGEVASRRLVDVVATLIMAHVGAGVYGAARLTGRRPEEALREAENQLCMILDAAIRLLRESFESGGLEEVFRRTVEEIGGQV